MKTYSQICLKAYSGSAIRLRIALILFAIILAGSVHARPENNSVVGLDEKVVNSCGPLSITEAFSLLGHSVSSSQCAKLAGTDPNGVTTLAGLQTAVSALGESATGMHLSPEELALIKRPAILHVSTPGIDDHYVVFASMTGYYFNLIDPLRDNVKEKYTAEQLRLMWQGDCLVFTPRPFLASLKVGAWRLRGIIAGCAGIVIGILMSILVIDRLAKHRRFPINTTLANIQKPVMTVLGIFVLVAAFGIVLSVQAIAAGRPVSKAPCLLLGNAALNLGDVDFGKPLHTAVWLGNTGSDTLKIDSKKIKGSCSCIRASASSSELKSGDKGYLRVYFNPPRKIGPFKYSLLVPSNDPHGDKVLTVKGRIIGAGGVVYPPQLYLGRVKNIEGVDKKLFYVLRRPDIKIVKVTCNLPSALCTFSKRNASAFEINVSLTELPKPGLFRGIINILTNDPETEYAKIAVPFSGIVEPTEGNRRSAGLYN